MTRLKTSQAIPDVLHGKSVAVEYLHCEFAASHHMKGRLTAQMTLSTAPSSAVTFSCAAHMAHMPMSNHTYTHRIMFTDGEEKRGYLRIVGSAQGPRPGQHDSCASL